jgi:hypothetical protein
MSKTILFLGLTLALVSATWAWFDPSPTKYGKVVITRANTYVTVPTNVDLSLTNTLVGVEFFDYGDIAPDITTNYGGDSNDTFHVAWPVTFFVYFFTNSGSVAEGGGYDQAQLQYFLGTNSFSDTEWSNITVNPITNFDGMVAVEGGHFGLVTWTPPYVTNSNYLVRVWARLANGMENASQTAINIDKDGNGSDWQDYEVLLIKTLEYKKPGARIDAVAPTDFDVSIKPDTDTKSVGFWQRLINFLCFWRR